MVLESWIDRSEPLGERRGDDAKLLKEYVYDLIMSPCDAVAFLHRFIAD